MAYNLHNFMRAGTSFAYLSWSCSPHACRFHQDSSTLHHKLYLWAYNFCRNNETSSHRYYYTYLKSMYYLVKLSYYFKLTVISLQIRYYFVADQTAEKPSRDCVGGSCLQQTSFSSPILQHQGVKMASSLDPL